MTALRWGGAAAVMSPTSIIGTISVLAVLLALAARVGLNAVYGPRMPPPALHESAKYFTYESIWTADEVIDIAV